MRCWLFESERLVYEGEGWGIIVEDNPHRKHPAYATHQTCTVPFSLDTGRGGDYVYGTLSWQPGYAFPACDNCEAPVPEGIQGLIIMMLWDK